MNYDEMKYAELQKAAKDAGLGGSGTKEELIARLKENDSADSSQNEPEASETPEVAENVEEEGNDEAEASEEPENPAEPAAPKVDEKVAQRQADKALRTDAAKMKAHLDSQKKVSMLIPFESGVNAEQAKDVPFHVNLNGYAVDYPRGRYIEVPEQIADIIKERLESEGKIGQEWRIDRDAKKQAALQG